MNAEKFLEQYEKVNHDVRVIEDEIDEMVNDYVSVKSTSDIDGLPHGTRTSDPTANAAIRLSIMMNDKRQEYADKILERVNIRALVFNAIMQIGGVEQEALYAKYILLKDEQGIMDYIHYERSMSYEYIRRGIIKLQVMIDNGEVKTSDAIGLKK